VSLVILLAACSGLTPLKADDWRLVVRRARSGHGEAPLLVSVPGSMPVGAYVLDAPGLGGPQDAQVFDDSGSRWLVTVTSAPLREGSYSLRHDAAGNPGHGDGVEISPNGVNLRIEVQGSRLTEYRIDAGPKPFYFPLIGPSGASYTRAYPMETVAGEDRDHPHQRSLWFTHGSVNGIDFWSEQNGHGTIKETSRKAVISGPVAGRLRTSDDWLGPEGKRVCADERVVTVYHSRSARVIDFDITLKATNGPVTFGDTKEGMFGLRVASSMDVNKKQGGRILNAEGLTDDIAWGKPSAWVDYSGPIQGKIGGITILNHPRSFRYPTTWHVRTYGLFAANPFGWHDFGLGKSGSYTLPAGQDLRFGYRVILHEGETTSAQVSDQFHQYAETAELEVLAL
jgi:hypothetical protein